MKLYVGVTDGEWYELLSRQSSLDEVNFWQPGGSSTFRALAPGELFLFKLHSPRNYIVGGGVFAHWTRLPVSLAWEAFGAANGVTSLTEMRRRIEKYRRRATDRHEDYAIGCILLEQPFFFPEERWIPIPEDWKPNIVQGKTYRSDEPAGRSLWEALRSASMESPAVSPTPWAGEPASRYGEPRPVAPRLGQGAFRIMIADTYERRCAISSERTLPALEAAHIRPFSEGGEHCIDNGLLLRRDLHALFDRGYITITPDHHLEVSQRIREEWSNGREYYAMHGNEVWVPPQPEARPREDLLRWHNQQRYRG